VRGMAVSLSSWKMLWLAAIWVGNSSGWQCVQACDILAQTVNCQQPTANRWWARLSNNNTVRFSGIYDVFRLSNLLFWPHFPGVCPVLLAICLPTVCCFFCMQTIKRPPLLIRHAVRSLAGYSDCLLRFAIVVAQVPTTRPVCNNIYSC